MERKRAKDESLGSWVGSKLPFIIFVLKLVLAFNRKRRKTVMRQKMSVVKETFEIDPFIDNFEIYISLNFEINLFGFNEPK